MLFSFRKQKPYTGGSTKMAASGIGSIKVLGAGCATCRRQYEYAKKAVELLGIPAKVDYITDMQTVTAYGVMRLPALVVDEHVAASGTVLKPADIVTLLTQQR